MNPNFREVYDYIIRYKQANDGNSPSVREIVANTSYKSTSTAWYALEGLVKEGLIELPPDPLSRQIRVVGAAWLPPEFMAEGS